MSEWMKKSPLEWEDYVYKEVRVIASEKKEYQGWLLTTDPVSAKWVCILLSGSNNSVSFLDIQDKKAGYSHIRIALSLSAVLTIAN